MFRQKSIVQIVYLLKSLFPFLFFSFIEWLHFTFSVHRPLFYDYRQEKEQRNSKSNVTSYI